MKRSKQMKKIRARRRAMLTKKKTVVAEKSQATEGGGQTGLHLITASKLDATTFLKDLERCFELCKKAKTAAEKFKQAAEKYFKRAASSASCENDKEADEIAKMFINAIKATDDYVLFAAELAGGVGSFVEKHTKPLKEIERKLQLLDRLEKQVAGK